MRGGHDGRGAGLLYFKVVPMNFLPDDDQSEFEVKVRAPEGTSLEATFVLLDRISRDVRRLGGVQYTLTSVADSDQRIANEGTVYVRMAPLRRAAVQPVRDDELCPQGNPAALSSAGVAHQRESGGRVLRRRHDAGRRAVHDRRSRHEGFGQYVQKVMGDLRTRARAVDVDSSLVVGKPQYGVTPDRAKANDLRVSVADVANTLKLLVAGQKVSDYNEKGEQYEVHVRATARFRNRLKELATVSVPSSKYDFAALADVVKITEGAGPAEINRLNRQRQVTISANMTPGTSQQTLLDSLDDSVPPSWAWAPTTGTGLLGKSKEMARTFRSFFMVFIRRHPLRLPGPSPPSSSPGCTPSPSSSRCR